ncbi:MAG: EF-P lysine aminoacylase EpmA [Myxococcota bacterium]
MLARVSPTLRRVNASAKEALMSGSGTLADGGPPPLGLLRARKRMKDAVRRFFDQRGFLEVETPILVPNPGLEVHLDWFEAELRTPEGARHRRFLHTSPEYAMKRLLGRGTPSCYQISRVFRNDELSDTHLPEFSMLEFYRRRGRLSEIEDDVLSLIEAVVEAVGGRRPERVIRLSMSEAFLERGLPDPLDLCDAENAAEQLGVREVDGDAFDDVLFRAFYEHVEPSWADDELRVLGGYPSSMAALAEVDPDDPRRALRSEVFWGKLELGNGYQELVDPVEQRRRLELDLHERRRRGKAVAPVDEGFMRGVAAMPPSAGIAVGLDRLFMKVLDRSSLREVVPFAPIRVASTHGPR